MSIPYNEEHWEAGQEATNRKKEEAMIKMSPEERGRIAAMEEAVRLLEAAQVPFMLFGSPNVPCSGIMQYNRDTYHPDRFGDEGYAEGNVFMNNACISALQFFATIHRSTFKAYAKDGTEIYSTEGKT